jgi:RNA polymerase sigma-70 factor (ECF subfamily)
MEMNLAAGSAAVTRPEKTRSTDPDAELARAAQADAPEFVAVYERYFRRVFGYVCVRIADRAGAEDVTSHILATGLAKIRSFRWHAPFAAWLFRIARNAVRDEQRRRRRPAAVLSEAALEDIPAADAGPEDLTVERERRAHLCVVASVLRRAQQHLLALRYRAGMSFEELGNVFGVAPGTARVRVP